MVRRAWVLMLGFALLATTVTHAEFEECESSTAPPTIGSVACRKLVSDAIGGVTAFSYYVPRGCDRSVQGQEDVRCPTLYVLHGFGGDYQSMLWTGSTSRAWPDSPWISALTKGPAKDPNHVGDPWNYADPAPWVTLDPIEMILVAPHGRTVVGGHGPAPGLDSFWTDWNPRYALDGEQQQYATPPPRFEAFLLEELVPYVEVYFPAAAGREARGIAGRSLGGYGSFVNALRRPDFWSTSSSISGAHNFLFAPVPNPLQASAPQGVAGVSEDVILPVPGMAPSVPITTYPEEIRGFLTAFFALGDPVADQAYYRGHMPRDLAMNGRAGAGGVQSIHFRYFHGDAVPRRTEDLGPSLFGDLGFETLVLPMNVAMEQAFEDQGVEREYELHPGLHSWEYSNAWLRSLLQAQYDRMRQKDSAGSPPPTPVTFDYRSTDATFEIWGWSFSVDREVVEFLNLRDVSCRGLTLQGTGTVTVTVPAACGTTHNGTATFTVPLGPSHPVNEPAGASALPVYGKTVPIELE